MLILDKNGRLVAVAAPPPEDSQLLEKISNSLADLEPFGKAYSCSKRGTFPIIEHGVQYGGGSKLPGPKYSGGSLGNQSRGAAAERFFHLPHVQKFCTRAAGDFLSSLKDSFLFVSDIFKKYFPNHFNYYDLCLQQVCDLVPDCSRPVGDLPFAGITLNVGKRSICNVHVDGCNLAGGICLVSPYGVFDHQNGGHLILHELKLALSLPPGSFILFPSALVSHENVPIAEHEERRAFTAFSPGALFQWVEEGFSSVPGLHEKLRHLIGEEDWRIQKSRFLHYSAL